MHSERDDGGDDAGGERNQTAYFRPTRLSLSISATDARVFVFREGIFTLSNSSLSVLVQVSTLAALESDALPSLLSLSSSSDEYRRLARTRP